MAEAWPMVHDASGRAPTFPHVGAGLTPPLLIADLWGLVEEVSEQ